MRCWTSSSHWKKTNWESISECWSSLWSWKETIYSLIKLLHGSITQRVFKGFDRRYVTLMPTDTMKHIRWYVFCTQISRSRAQLLLYAFRRMFWRPARNNALCLLKPWTGCWFYLLTTPLTLTAAQKFSQVHLGKSAFASYNRVETKVLALFARFVQGQSIVMGMKLSVIMSSVCLFWPYRTAEKDRVQRYSISIPLSGWIEYCWLTTTKKRLNWKLFAQPEHNWHKLE